MILELSIIKYVEKELYFYLIFYITIYFYDIIYISEDIYVVRGKKIMSINNTLEIKLDYLSDILKMNL